MKRWFAIIIVTLLFTGTAGTAARAQNADQSEYPDGSVGYDPTASDPGTDPDTTPAGGTSGPGDVAEIKWTEPFINGKPAAGQTVTTGNSYSAIPVISGLNTDYYNYKLMIGKIEGSLPGDNNKACLDVQSGMGVDEAASPDYGAGVVSGGVTVDVDNNTSLPRFSDTVTRASLGAYKYHLIAFLFRASKTEAFESLCNTKIYLVRRISFSSSTSSSSGGGETFTTVPTPPRIPINTSPFGGSSGSLGGSSANRVDEIDSLPYQDIQNDPTRALCLALTITLPGNKGVVNFEQAGVLGLCNTRPLLMNLINILTILAGIFFVVSVIYSGIMLIQAPSDDVAAKAKRNLVWSATGAVVVMLANWIVPYIIYLLVSATS